MPLGSIYFIQEGREGAIKIGWTSNDPHRRRDNLQIGNSHDLHLIGIVPNVEKGAEASWHLRLAAHRKRSEWFYPTEEVMAAVRAQFPAPPRHTLKPILVSSRAAEDTKPMVEWMKANRVRQKVMAKRFGMAQSSVSQILNGSRGMTKDFALKCEIFTDGAVSAATLLGLAEARAA